MEVEQAIKERRTVRNYSEKPVAWDLIIKCIEAAIWAPNAGNMQDFRFVLVREKEMIEKVSKTCENQRWIETAPALIVVCSDLTQCTRFFGKRGETLYSIQNCAAAIENLLLMAIDMGLGTAWVGAYDEEKLGEVLGITGNVKIMAVIALGYAKKKTGKVLREEVDNFIYYETYGQKEDKTKVDVTLKNKLRLRADQIKRELKSRFEK